MCGRFSLTASVEAIFSRFRVSVDTLIWKPRYNLAPTQNALTITNGEGAHQIHLMSWGLVPHWSKDKESAYQMINARAETLAAKPSFKNLLKRQRCLVVADGFYEWKAKIPYRITLKDQKLFSFAGLYDSWQSPEGQSLTSFTIITVPANPLLSSLHDRMPAILAKDHEGCWLDPAYKDPTILLEPYPAKEMALYEVSPMVSSWKNDTPECIVPVVR